MKTIKIAAITLISGLLTIPAANAASFNVKNDTNYALAFYINGVSTSTLGTVLPHESKTVSEADFRKACGKGEECLVQSYVVAMDPPSIYAGGIIYNEKQSTFFLDGGDAKDLSIFASLNQNPAQLNMTFTQALK